MRMSTPRLLLFSVLLSANSLSAVYAQSISTNGTSGISIYSGDTVVIHTERGGGTASTTDWVGLYAAGASASNYPAYWYLNGSMTPPTTALASATFSVAVKRLPGNYEFRFFANNGYTTLAISGSVVVNNALFQVSGVLPPQDFSVETQDSVAIDIHGSVGNQFDWVGLYEVSATNSNYLDWVWLGTGTRTTPQTGATSSNFRMLLPSADGDYEFRILLNNGYTSVATSTRALALTSPVTHTIDNGTTQVGINLNWGGAITKLSFPVNTSVRYRNVVNNEDGPGRQVEAAVYHSTNDPECWPCDNSCTWGYNPVQAGNACHDGSVGTLIEQTSTKLVTSTTALQWNNILSGGPVSNVTIRQTIELTQAQVLKIDYTITNDETFSIGSDIYLHELPVVYLNWATSKRAFAYQGSNPFTSGTLTEFSIPCCNEQTGLISTSEPWIAWVDSSPGSGSALNSPAVALYVPGKYTNWQIATRTTTSALQNWETLVLAPSGQATVTAYLVFGSNFADVRARIYAMEGY